MSVEIVEMSQQSIGRNVLLYPLLRQLSVAQIIDTTLECEAEIAYGTIAEVIILSRFSDKRVPMYRINEFYEANGLETFYYCDWEKLNDDRIGRCLDAMAEKLPEMKRALILSAIKEFDLNVSQIHTDITNSLLEGNYDSIEPGQLQVTFGHTNKGQDPRCKQVNFSLSVTNDGGVPLYYQAVDGNRGDDPLYLPHLEALQTQLGITHPLVVGDSKLVSNKNMIAIYRADARFIGPSILDTKEKKVLQKLWEGGKVFEA